MAKVKAILLKISFIWPMIYEFFVVETTIPQFPVNNIIVLVVTPAFVLITIAQILFKESNVKNL